MRHAYVATLCGGDAYAPGVEALGHSLRASGSAVERLLLVTADVPEGTRRRLAAQGWAPRAVDPITPPDRERLYSRFVRSFIKLRAFELVGYDKVVLLDADTLVLRNVDDLFERPAIAAAPDFFMPDRFNSGVMVIEPSRELFLALSEALAAARGYDGGDQGFLNSFWPDWWAMPAGHRLPARYNIHHFIFQFMLAHPILRRQFLEEVRIVHYTLQKPWLDFELTGGAALWWRTWFALHPEQDTAWKRRLHALQDWSFDSIVSALGG